MFQYGAITTQGVWHILVFSVQHVPHKALHTASLNPVIVPVLYNAHNLSNATSHLYSINWSNAIQDSEDTHLTSFHNCNCTKCMKSDMYYCIYLMSVLLLLCTVVGYCCHCIMCVYCTVGLCTRDAPSI